MVEFDRKKHWEEIYQTKQQSEVSWYQPTPLISLSYFEQFKIPKEAKIIDVGGGDSFLVDNLLDKGYKDITVLDISSASLERAKIRLGENCAKIKWIVADAANFNPTETYDFWHDRAAFHFLTQEEEIKRYINTVQKNIKPSGILVIGTFSELGPEKCSGIKIKQYSEASMTDRLKEFFEKIECKTVEHLTPSDTIQQFVFCSFRKPLTT